MIIYTQTLKETYVIQSRLWLPQANGGKGAWTSWNDLMRGISTPEAAQICVDRINAEGREYRIVRRTDTLVETA